MFRIAHVARYATLAALVGALSACSLPRSGPTKAEILAGSIEQSGNAHVVPITDHVTRATAGVPGLGFDRAFIDAGILGSDTIQPGDTLGISIWENVDSPLLGAQGMPATTLEEIQVDGAGFIFIPYAGRLRAAGNNPEAVRRLITDRLETQTPDPQVMVRRMAGDGATVSLSGAISGQGVYPIERPTRTLSSMLARAGGVAVEPEVARITVMRGTQKGTIWFEDLFANPAFDIALRDGDRILVERDSRAFTTLGALGAQNRIPFDSQSLSAIEALAQVGGLSSTLADPTGVFVFRDESESVARAVLGRDDLHGPQRLIYVLDLTSPNGIFSARDFMIRNGDTLYVTEAPFVQWSKTLNAVTGSLTSANSLNTLAGN